ncbi:MAG: glycosyltransferase [Candidatus Falkowbacteria bacterium]
MSKSKNPGILYVASYPPRECGIATFTKRLTSAIDKEFNPEIKSRICAINSNGSSIYNYPRKVVMQINETEIEDYINRANEINKSQEIRLVNIQHEYGLFGGEQGEFLIPFIELLNKPVVITMHTVLPRPDDKMRKVGEVIAKKSAAIVVMNSRAKDILRTVYRVDQNKIHVIPHGVFHVPFPSKSKAKQKLNLSGRTIISTFGMISRDKGIEYAIEALPDVVAKYPDVLYLIIGATHPQVLKREGERYRNKLRRLIVKHNLKDHVKFYDRYLEEKEVVDFLKATDIYVYPMLSREQASSGSLSDAMACGCPAIATPSQYAKSVLNHERGVLVRFRNSKDIRAALLELLSDPKARKEMIKNTYFYTRFMTWQNVALSYFKLFNRFAKIVPQEKGKLPAISLDYIKILTDDFGIIQFAVHTKPDTHSGYCLDDNTRALLGCAIRYGRHRVKSTLSLINIYLKFMEFTQKPNGRFHNFVSYQRTYNDINESDDSFGRAIWALGTVVGNKDLPDDIISKARKILDKSIESSFELSSLRGVAFSIIGLSRLAEAMAAAGQTDEQSAKVMALIEKLSNRLLEEWSYQQKISSDRNWQWFEDCLTYSNYKLPEALYHAFRVTKDKKYLNIAERSLQFLISTTFENKEYFSPIGQDGWYFRNGKRAYYDQQPEDAASATEALVMAHKVTKKKIYKDKAEMAFYWFLGKNHLNQMVYDEATGGCYDGLGRYSLNFNQGAESTLSYFLARLAIEEIEK